MTGEFEKPFIEDLDSADLASAKEIY